MVSRGFGRFCAESLYFAAKRYRSQGYSVIPVNGTADLKRPKLPAIKWGRYQYVQPDEAELEDWFLRKEYGGLAVVCGRVSRLIVLDFDDAQHASEFRRIFPDLADTFEVRSGGRGLPHFYWRIPEGQIVPTRSFTGADLRGEGSYVVAAPTQLGSGKWEVVNDVEPRLLSEVDLRRILRFLAGLTRVLPETGCEWASGSIAGASCKSPDASEFRRIQSEHDLVEAYHGLVYLGRNNALFRVACLSRDLGWGRERVVLALAHVHGEQPGPSTESYQQRYAEAVRTIASAFSRPPRRSHSVDSDLSNAVREGLLKRGLGYVARVLDGLYAAGMKAGQHFTERLACQVLSAFRIGRRSVMAALKASVDGMRGIFSCSLSASDTPPLNPPIQANAAEHLENLKNSCEMSTGAKRVKSGRPAVQYRLPSSADLAEKMGVQGVQGDALEAEDLSSPKAYRQALHRELLKRRPGQYPRRWLATRLGVSKWTTRRYEAALNVRVQPMFHQESLRWSNLKARLPEKKADAPPGLFIEDASGKRYPPLRAIAARLLKRGASITLKRQQANYYAYGQPTCVGIPTHWVEPEADMKAVVGTRYISSLQGTPSVAPVLASTCVGIPTHHPEPLHFWYCTDCLNHCVQAAQPAGCLKCGAPDSWERLPESIWRDTESLKAHWQAIWREHQHAQGRDTAVQTRWKSPGLEPDSEALARRARDTVHDLSLRNARNLVSRYGQRAVAQGLSLLAARPGVRSPAAFLTSVLKSECKISINSYNVVSQRVNCESQREWIQHMAASPYADFLSNRHDLNL